MSSTVLTDANADDISNKITVLLIGIGSAALVVTIYHCIAVGWCNRDRVGANSQQQRQEDINNARERPSSIENSAAQLIPAFRYRKGMGLRGDEEETCAICLSEFEEGEELRTLPECTHTYHLACIDTWLYSHPNCPVCRAAAVSLDSFWRTMEVHSEGSNTYQDLNRLQNIVIHSRTV